MQIDTSRLVPIGTLCAWMRLLLDLFVHEGAFLEGGHWHFAVENLLFPAACLSDVKTDAFSVDPYQAWMHCSHAADYDGRQSSLLDDYMSALARFHFVWTAYETVRSQSKAGRLLTSRDVDCRKAPVERIPCVHKRLVESIYRTSKSLVGEDEAILGRLKKGDESVILGEAGLL